MAGASEFRELVSGRRSGVLASLARMALSTLEVPYSALRPLRNWRYDTGRAAIHRAQVPVVSVGNLTLGGTGKTPAVEWLARWYAERGVRVGLASRGYGVKPGELNDEALELAEKLPGVPHVLDRDRVAAAHCLVEAFRCRLVILDDAFQHRRLARDLDVVLVDALEPFGFGRVFPRGTLREPLAGWRRADVLLLTRRELIAPEERRAIRDQARSHAPGAVWAEATYTPRALRQTDGVEIALGAYRGQRVAAFCGIGNPTGFHHSLIGTGYDPVEFRAFPDHFPYAMRDIDQLVAWADRLKVAALVCTHKDLVKIGERWPPCCPLVALASRLEIVEGLREFEARLAPLVERSGAAPR